ncbi:hypothetical protein [Streptomyces sp. OR43]|uniref:hypothetical protein n=1 Tax=Streptomyces sp. or43 TaxID=2478957 RepID=UPI0011CE3248|nr:hypothetical protein [Streptomyces sp. or43]
MVTTPTYRYDLTGPARWLNYLLSEPREAAYCIPRRIACRLFSWHNVTCRGLPAPHPRSW